MISQRCPQRDCIVWVAAIPDVPHLVDRWQVLLPLCGRDVVEEPACMGASSHTVHHNERALQCRAAKGKWVCLHYLFNARTARRPRPSQLVLPSWMAPHRYSIPLPDPSAPSPGPPHPDQRMVNPCLWQEVSVHHCRKAKAGLWIGHQHGVTHAHVPSVPAGCGTWEIWCPGPERLLY